MPLKDRLNDLGVELEALETLITEHGGRLDIHKGRIDDHSDRIAVAENNIGLLDATLNEARAKLGAHDGDIAALVARVEALEGSATPVPTPDPTPDPEPPVPDPDPVPAEPWANAGGDPSVRTLYTGPLTINDQDGFVLANMRVLGQLRLNNCRNAHIINCEFTNASFSGLWLDNCSDFLVQDCHTHHNGSRNSRGNPVGHGLFFSGNSTGEVWATWSHDNIEDGSQFSPSMTGEVLFSECNFERNEENAHDHKGAGKAIFSNCRLTTDFQESSDPDYTENPGEVVLLHQNAGRVELYNCLLESLNVNKAFVSLNEGTGLVRDCKIIQGATGDGRFFRITGNYTGKNALPAFTQGALTVENTIVVG